MLPLCKEEKIAVVPWARLQQEDWHVIVGASTARSKIDEIGKNLNAAIAERDRRWRKNYNWSYTAGKAECKLHARGKWSGESVADITMLCPQSTILDGLAARGGEVKSAEQDIRVDS